MSAQPQYTPLAAASSAASVPNDRYGCVALESRTRTDGHDFRRLSSAA